MMVTVCVLGGRNCPGGVGLDRFRLNVRFPRTKLLLMMGTGKCWS